MPWPENNKANDILTLNVYSSSSPMLLSPEDASREQNWRIVWRVQCWVKRREAASHERHASRQVKWIKYTNDRSTLLCNIRPFQQPADTQRQHERLCECKFHASQKKRNWHAHSRTFSRGRMWDGNFIAEFGHCRDIKQVRISELLKVCLLPEREVHNQYLIWHQLSLNASVVDAVKQMK